MVGKAAARDGVDGVFGIIGEAVSISASTSPTFRAGKTLTDTENAGIEAVTLRRQPAATRGASSSQDMESTRFRYDNGFVARALTAVRKTQHGHGLTGWPPSPPHARLNIRQEGRVSMRRTAFATIRNAADYGQKPHRLEEKADKCIVTVRLNLTGGMPHSNRPVSNKSPTMPKIDT